MLTRKMRNVTSKGSWQRTYCAVDAVAGVLQPSANFKQPFNHRCDDLAFTSRSNVQQATTGKPSECDRWYPKHVDALVAVFACDVDKGVNYSFSRSIIFGLGLQIEPV